MRDRVRWVFIHPDAYTFTSKRINAPTRLLIQSY